MATNNMHMKFEIEIPNWIKLRSKNVSSTDGWMDEVNPVYYPHQPSPTSLGGGIKRCKNFRQNKKSHNCA